MNYLGDIRLALLFYSDERRAQYNQRYSKTGIGEYGQGDRFLGVAMPQIRYLGKLYEDISHTMLAALITSPFHEERILALVILVHQYRQCEDDAQTVVDFYTTYIDHINN